MRSPHTLRILALACSLSGCSLLVAAEAKTATKTETAAPTPAASTVTSPAAAAAQAKPVASATPTVEAATAAAASVGTEAKFDLEATVDHCLKVLRYGKSGNDFNSQEYNRTEAIAILGVLHHPRALPVLVEYLQNDQDPMIRSRILKTLSNYDLQQSQPLLEAALNDKDTMVRMTARNLLRILTGKIYNIDSNGTVSVVSNVQQFGSVTYADDSGTVVQKEVDPVMLEKTIAEVHRRRLAREAQKAAIEGAPAAASSNGSSTVSTNTTTSSTVISTTTTTESAAPVATPAPASPAPTNVEKSKTESGK